MKVDDVLGCVSSPSVCRRGRETGRSGGGVFGASGEPVIADSSIVIVGARGLVGLGDGFASAPWEVFMTVKGLFFPPTRYGGSQLLKRASDIPGSTEVFLGRSPLPP